MELKDPKETMIELAGKSKKNFYVMAAAAAVVLGVGAFSFMSNKVPECDDSDVLELAQQIFKRDYERSAFKLAIFGEALKMQKEQGFAGFSNMSNEEVIKKILEKMRNDPQYAPAFEKLDEILDTMEIVNIRASSIDKEIGRVSCKADVHVSDGKEEQSVPIEYSAQRMKNGDLIVEML